MYKNYKIRTPFFEFGPKCYMYGDVLLKLAKELDALSEKYDIDIILDIPDTEIKNVADNTKNLHIYSQHMDSLEVGRGMGRTLPEAVKAAGAVGVMLNHAEHKLTIDEIKAAIARADEVGLATIVCADSVDEVKQIAALGPNILVAEPTELIGTGTTADKEYVESSIRMIAQTNPDVIPFISAGISCGDDCYNMIKLGSAASGSSSAIAKAEDPAAVAEEMIAAVKRAYDEMK